MDFKPSKYQTAIFDFVKNETGNGVVQACAGSGKTTTIVSALDMIPANKRVLFCAFNKRIADELQTRVPKHVRAATLNAIGWGILRSMKGDCKLDAKKSDAMVYAVAKKAMGEGQQTEIYVNEVKYAMSKLIGLAKANMLNHKDEADMVSLLELMQDSDSELKDSDFPILRAAYTLACNTLTIVDFDDQIFQPVARGWVKGQYDFVMVDEAQDLSKAQMELVTGLCRKGGRVVAVGDKRQAIYAFRGADYTAMDKLQATLNAKELPLSVCYRCPKNVVNHAKEIAPEIESHPDAPEGSVKFLQTQAMMDTVKVGDFILSRTNAPLLGMAFKLVAKKIPAKVLGADVAVTLVNTIKRLAGAKKPGQKYTEDTSVVVANAIEERDKQVSVLMLANKVRRAALIQEKYDTIIGLASVAPTTTECIEFIHNVFTNSVGGAVTLSSIHKAKGLEADKVYLLTANLPHPLAQTESAQIQESNLKYVGITRAKMELVFVSNK